VIWIAAKRGEKPWTAFIRSTPPVAARKIAIDPSPPQPVPALPIPATKAAAPEKTDAPKSPKTASPAKDNIPKPKQFTSKPYDLGDSEKRATLISLLKKEWHTSASGVVLGGDASYERESLRFGCLAWSDRACAAAGDFLVAFSEAGWKIEQTKVLRYDTAVPHFGIAVITQPEGTEEQRKGLLPHEGLWHKASPSEVDIILTLQQIGLRATFSSDPSLPAGTIGLYFGPEP
jgi:hypothetical protein